MADRTEAEIAQAVVVRSGAELLIQINRHPAVASAFLAFVAALQMSLAASAIQESAAVISISKR